MDQSAICVLLASPFPMMNNLGDGNNGLVERLLWVASRRWAPTDGFHRLDGWNRPIAVFRCGGTQSRLADQKAVVHQTYLIAPVHFVWQI